MKGESLAAAALSFAATYGVDLLRMPVTRDLPLGPQTSIDRPHDLTQLGELSGLTGFWLERTEALKYAYRMAEKKLAIFETIPEPWTALSYVARKELLRTTESNHPTFLEKALSDVTASLGNYVERLISEECIDGLVIEIESATYEQREPESFESTIKPHLERLLTRITAQRDIPIWLHVRGTRVYLAPLVDLPHHMISWPHLSAGPRLESALPKGYSGNLAGGLNEQAIADMSYQDIRLHIEEARDQPVSLITVGDGLPSDLSPSRLRALADFLSKRDRLPPDKR